MSKGVNKEGLDALDKIKKNLFQLMSQGEPKWIMDRLLVKHILDENGRIIGKDEHDKSILDQEYKRRGNYG